MPIYCGGLFALSLSDISNAPPRLRRTGFIPWTIRIDAQGAPSETLTAETAKIAVKGQAREPENWR
jgi:hypothetical protein